MQTNTHNIDKIKKPFYTLFENLNMPINMKTKLSTKRVNFCQKFNRKAPERPNSSITIVCMLGSLAITNAGYSTERSETTVRNEVNGWMKNHPVMNTQARTISKVETYPNATTPGAVSVVSLSPKGTVVVNRDTRLPMIVMFTADTTILDLEEFSEEVIHASQILKTLGPNETYVGVAPTTTNDVYVPAILKTAWGQWAPYNSYMPYNPETKDLTGKPYRTVTGCGTIGMAQILKHYQWPPYGEGKKTHTDKTGTFQPTFSSNFEHAYQWDLMRDNFKLNDAAKNNNAVAQLAYDIAVIGDIVCDNNSSAIGLDNAGTLFGTYLFYEKENIVVGDAESRQAIEDNLKKGIPVPADISINHNGNGHAIVFDGLLINNGSTSYHTNFGWYGQYNLWWDKDAILAVWDAKPGIQPALVPLPTNRNLVAKQGEPLQLPWKIATQRKAEAKQLNLYQEVLKNGTWEDDCESLPSSVDTRSWSLDNNGVSGSCWKANSPFPADYLTAVDEFVPTRNSVIDFQEKHVCVNNYIEIEASVDGAEFQPIVNFGKEVRNTWEAKSVSLASFAGKPLKLRFVYHAPPNTAYYSNDQGGGIWIDNVRVTNTLVKDWELLNTIDGSEIQTISGQDAITTHPSLKDLMIGTYNLSASLTDATNVERRAGSDFTLTVTKTGDAQEKFEVREGNKLRLSGITLKMGMAKVNRKKVTELVIKNTGTETIRRIEINTLGPDRKDFTATIARSTLAPGATTTLKIQFQPSKTGPRRINVKISTKAGGHFSVNVCGTGKPD